MTAICSMREALADEALLGTVLPGDSWLAWRIQLVAMNSEPLLPDELPIFEELSGGKAPPTEPLDEYWGLIGRRGGKSRAMATRAIYKAALCDHSARVAPGERPVVLFLAANQKQAGVAFNYCAGIFESVPLLRSLVTNKTADTIQLSNGVDLEIRAASKSGIRGVTAIEVLADEVAFWNVDQDSHNSDASILDAVRPALATTGGMLLAITSPYAKRGQAFEQFQRNFGPHGDPRILVVRAESRKLNPNLPQAVVDRALARDPQAARAEYLALFRDDLETFVSVEAVDRCIIKGRRELPPAAHERMAAFLDVSGGVHDSHCLAIAFFDQLAGVVKLAYALERKGSDTDAVVQEFSRALKTYGLDRAYCDRYGSAWVANAFQRHNVRLEYSPKSKSELFLELLPAICSSNVELLDLDRLRLQLISLERRITSTGREIVDHPSGGHDDLANAVAGAITFATKRRERDISELIITSGPPNPDFAWFNPDRDFDRMAAGVVTHRWDGVEYPRPH